MGKSRICFTIPKTMPLDPVAELEARMTVEEWIEVYERCEELDRQ